MIKKVREKTKSWQIHKQLIVLILLTGMVSVLLFEVLWLSKWNIYEYVRQIPGLHDISLDEDFWEDLRAEATKYDIPSSEDDKAGIKKIQPFLEQGDKYTGIYIYTLKEGNYITGRFPKALENAAFSTFFDTTKKTEILLFFIVFVGKIIYNVYRKIWKDENCEKRRKHRNF